MPEVHFTWENEIKRETAACICGNRRSSSFTDEDCRDGTAVDNIRQVVTDAYEIGYRFFFALTNYNPFEVIAGEVVLDLKKSCPGIQLIALALPVGEPLDDELAERGKAVWQAADKKEILPVSASREVALYQEYVTGICGMMIGNFPRVDYSTVSRAVGLARANHMEMDNRIGKCLWGHGPSAELPSRSTVINRESAKARTVYFCSDLSIPCGNQTEAQFKEAVKKAVSSSIEDGYTDFMVTLDCVYQLVCAECVLEWMKENKNIRCFIVNPYLDNYLSDQPSCYYNRMYRVERAASSNEYYRYWSSDAAIPLFHKYLAGQYSRLLYFHLDQAVSRSADAFTHLAKQNGTYILFISAHEFKQELGKYGESEGTTICFYCNRSKYAEYPRSVKKLDRIKNVLKDIIAEQVEQSGKTKTMFVVVVCNWISILFMELVIEASAYPAMGLQYILPENVHMEKIARDSQGSYYPLSEMKLRSILEMAEPIRAENEDWDFLSSLCAGLLYLVDIDETQEDEILQTFERQGKYAHSILAKTIHFKRCTRPREFEEVLRVLKSKHGKIDDAVALEFFNAGVQVETYW